MNLVGHNVVAAFNDPSFRRDFATQFTARHMNPGKVQAETNARMALNTLLNTQHPRYSVLVIDQGLSNIQVADLLEAIDRRITPGRRVWVVILHDETDRDKAQSLESAARLAGADACLPRPRDDGEWDVLFAKVADIPE